MTNNFQILDANMNLVMLAGTPGGAKRSACNKSKKEPGVPFTVFDSRMGRPEAVYLNGELVK